MIQEGCFGKYVLLLLAICRTCSVSQCLLGLLHFTQLNLPLDSRETDLRIMFLQFKFHQSPCGLVSGESLDALSQIVQVKE